MGNFVPLFNGIPKLLLCGFIFEDHETVVNVAQ